MAMKNIGKNIGSALSKAAIGTHVAKRSSGIGSIRKSLGGVRKSVKGIKF